MENVYLMKSFVQGFGAGLYLQFVINVVDVFLHGFLANEELNGNLFVEVSLSEKIKYFRFTLGEQFNRFICFSWIFAWN